MSNINTVDNTRAVVTDKIVTNTGISKGPATSDRDSGKTMPVSERVKAPDTSQQMAKVNQQRSARVEKAVEQLNEYAQSFQRDLTFSMDEDLGRTIVRVVDRTTQEVIRQIPNETALRLARNLNALNEMKRVEEMEQLQMSGNSAEASLGLINTRI
ncbi:MAG: flagellar protein FlaG [bacterium]